ncbi:hypothetical protein SAMN05192561_10961 [Halopenitus malekzadehii]|uniref:Uncharacterized protein n=1 Tax=Halopenitus malekzadehii TaxID=1267564 RepID=A0A1H6JHA1_9EURY|nr:DUF5810 domain-containing protein [Halopenitus malekzadehii]SEH58472.1 hypothetical protein SAMN05192561_10961 [Halopenitus malekzadehii]
MGYACPVCETPQRDGEHLAHHLAFTAMLHGGDHEAWLDEHAPEWAGREPEALAAEVTEYADDAEYHEVFEDTVHDRGRPDVDGGGPGTDGNTHDHAGHDHTHTNVAGSDQGPIDDETRAVLEEARGLTRRMMTDDEDGDGGDGNVNNDEFDAGAGS